MNVMVLLMVVLLVPAILFVLGCLVQAIFCRRIDAAWAIPAIAFVLVLAGWIAFMCKLNPLILHGPVIGMLAVAGTYLAITRKMEFPFREGLAYLCVAWVSMLFLASANYVCFALDWILHGIQIPMKLVAGESFSDCRPYLMSLIYSDVYRIFAPVFSQYFVIQVLSASFNAGIVFVFLRMIGYGRWTWPAVACFFCCPFIVHEIMMGWPKFFAVSVAFLAVEQIFSGDFNWRKAVIGVIAAVFSVLVHPLAMFVLVVVPFFMPRSSIFSISFAARWAIVCCVCLVIPPLVMRTLGITLVSSILYYPFFNTWHEAAVAQADGRSILSCYQTYMQDVGLLGAIKIRVISLVHVFVPISDLSRHSFWQNLIFSLGPAPFVLAVWHMLSRGIAGGLQAVMYALGPVLLGLAFSVGYMILQVAGGHWLVVVLAVYACRQLSEMKPEQQKVALMLSVLWNSTFMAVSVYRIHNKAPDWALGIEDTLNKLGMTLPGFSSQTPIYFADLVSFKFAMAFYVLAGVAIAFIVAGKNSPATSSPQAEE